MIASIGEARLKDGVCRGLALTLAVQAAEKGSSVAMLGPVSTDQEGGAILEFLVDHWVMFDPDLAQNPLPSDQVLESLTEEGLQNALKVNSDIRLAYVGGIALTGSCGGAILSALHGYEPRPILMMEPAESTEDGSRLMKLLKRCDLVKLTEKELRLLGPDDPLELCLEQVGKRLGVRDLWVHENGRNRWWNEEGWVVELPASGNPEKESGTVCAVLHEQGCFGNDGQNPGYHVSRQAVVKALEACREA